METGQSIIPGRVIGVEWRVPEPASVPPPQAWVAITQYEAINLLAALDVVPDTGDWHGQMRSKLAEIAADERVARSDGPNMSPTDQRRQIATSWKGVY